MTEPERLRNLLRTEARALSDAATRDGGHVDPEKLAAVERLARLNAILVQSEPGAPRPRWPLIAAFAATAVLSSVLLFGTLPSTALELDVVAGEASFVLGADTLVADGLRLSRLAASGVNGADVPTMGAAGLPQWKAQSAVWFEGGTTAGRPSELSLSDIQLPSGAELRVAKPGGERTITLSLRGLKRSIGVNAYGQVRMGGDDAPPIELKFGMPRRISVEPGAQETTLNLTLRDGSHSMLATSVPITRLSLHRVDDRRTAQGTFVREVSMVRSGSLYFGDLNGEERRLRTGDPLLLDGVRGQIHALSIEPDGIRLRFEGAVRDIRTGSFSNPKTLKPSLLEWLRANKTLHLFWGTAIYCFGLLMGALRWLRVT